jgi:peroxiredoxin Q/BCP
MAVCGLLVSIVAAAAGDVPAVGADVPDFKMTDQAGRLVTAASLSGKRYLLAFYPKDFTPG